MTTTTRPMLWPHNEGWCAQIEHRVYRIDLDQRWLRATRVRIDAVNSDRRVYVPARSDGYLVTLDGVQLRITVQRRWPWSPRLTVEAVE